jgi:uncharacterized membrane protein YkoI
MKLYRFPYGCGLVAMLAIGCTTTSTQAQLASGFSGSIPVPEDDGLSDDAEYERNLGLVTVMLADAIQAATSHLGGTASPFEIELDNERGYLVWEVTLDEPAQQLSADTTVLVDAGNANILATVPEDTDEDVGEAQVSLLESAAAAKIALKQNGDPSSVSLDRERGRLVWEIEFGEQEVDIDAITGRVVVNSIDNLD